MNERSMPGTGRYGSRMLYLLALVIAALALPLVASAQEEDDETVKPDPQFEIFLEQFREAVDRGDKKAVADMTFFPFFSYDLMGWSGRTFEDGPDFERADFLAQYDVLFTDMAKMLIATGTPTALYVEDDGTANGYAIGIHSTENSTTWITLARTEEGEWKLVGTDNISWGGDDEEDGEEYEYEEYDSEGGDQ